MQLNCMEDTILRQARERLLKAADSPRGKSLTKEVFLTVEEIEYLVKLIEEATE